MTGHNNDNTDPSDAIMAAVVKLPPALLTQAICEMVTAYVNEQIKAFNEHDLTAQEFSEQITVEGFVEHYTDLLSLTNTEAGTLGTFITDPAVARFTNYPPTNLV